MSTLPPVASLRHRLVLEAPVDTPDAAGGVARRFVAAGWAWCAVTPVRASDAPQADAPALAVTHRVTLRWRAGVTAAMRWRDGDRVLDIRTVFDPDERRRALVCLCQENRP